MLLLDHGETSLTYPHRGRRLPMAPSLIPSFESSPAMKDVIKELGMGPDVRAALTPLAPAFQAVMPQHRFDLWSDPAQLERELKLEFPDLGDQIGAVLSRIFQLDDELTALLETDPPLAPEGLRDRLKLRSIVKTHGHLAEPLEQTDLLAPIPPEHPVRDLLLGPLTFFSHLAGSQSSLFHTVRLLARYLRGSLTFADQLGDLTPLLLQAAERSGVDIHRGAVVHEITIQGRNLGEIRVDGERMPYRADFYVADTLHSFADLLPPGRVQKRLAADPRASRRVGSLLTLNLVVKREVVPRGMARAVFLLNGRRASRDGQPADPPVFLRRYAETDRNGGTKGEHEILSIACPALLRDVQDYPDRLASLRALLMARVRRVIPFLDEHVVDKSFPIDTGEWDHVGDHRRADPWGAHAHYVLPEPPLLGVGGRSPITPLGNLYHCGPDLFPGLGMEGEFAAARLTAAALGKHRKARWMKGKG